MKGRAFRRSVGRFVIIIFAYRRRRRLYDKYNFLTRRAITIESNLYFVFSFR